MVKKITPDVADKFLSEVPNDSAFFINHGPVLKSISQLADYLEHVGERQFSYYRNSEKNDFYNWILNVVGDVKLANDVARAKTKLTTLKKLKHRINYLNSIKGY